MEYPAITDYTNITTQELEAMVRRSSDSAERQAISAELSRRYASLYRTPNAASTGTRNARQRRQQFPTGASGPVIHGTDNTSSGSTSTEPPISRFNQQHLGPGVSRINALAVWSIISAVLWMFWWGSLTGIILGLIALRQTRERNQPGRLLAMSGILIGFLSFLVLFLLVVASS